jgi:hypothetical protein
MHELIENRASLAPTANSKSPVASNKQTGKELGSNACVARKSLRLFWDDDCCAPFFGKVWRSFQIDVSGWARVSPIYAGVRHPSAFVVGRKCPAHPKIKNAYTPSL